MSCSSRTPTFYSSLLQSLCHSRTKLNLPSSLQCISLLLLFIKLMSFIQLEVKAQLLVRGCQRLMDLRTGEKKQTKPKSSSGIAQHLKQSEGTHPARSYSKTKMQVEISLPNNPRPLGASCFGIRNGRGHGVPFSARGSQSPGNCKGMKLFSV